MDLKFLNRLGLALLGTSNPKTTLAFKNTLPSLSNPKFDRVPRRALSTFGSGTRGRIRDTRADPGHEGQRRGASPFKSMAAFVVATLSWTLS